MKYTRVVLVGRRLTAYAGTGVRATAREQRFHVSTTGRT